MIKVNDRYEKRNHADLVGLWCTYWFIRMRYLSGGCNICKHMNPFYLIKPILIIKQLGTQIEEDIVGPGMMPEKNLQV